MRTTPTSLRSAQSTRRLRSNSLRAEAKLNALHYPTDSIDATTQIAQAAARGEVLTGLLYLSPDSEDLHAHLNTYPAAFNKLGDGALPRVGDAG